nr:MAG TPA: hypothetical protein [Caudoviricetes sp.]
MLIMTNWYICTPPKFCLGFEGDNEAVALEISTDLTDEWDLMVDVEKDGQKNIIQLQRVGQLYSALLTASMLADDGQYLMQVRGTLGEQVRHSNIFYATVHDSINAVDAFPPPLPSEFEQMEERITELNQHPPRPGLDGFWEIWNPESGQYEASDIPLPESGGGTSYNIGHGLKLDRDTRTLSVDTVNGFDEGDNTLPITAAAVQETVGNIEILLGTI